MTMTSARGRPSASPASSPGPQGTKRSRHTLLQKAAKALSPPANCGASSLESACTVLGAKVNKFVGGSMGGSATVAGGVAGGIGGFWAVVFVVALILMIVALVRKGLVLGAIGVAKPGTMCA